MDIDIREFDLHRVSATQIYFPSSVTCFCSIYGKSSKIFNTFLVLFLNKTKLQRERVKGISEFIFWKSALKIKL